MKSTKSTRRVQGIEYRYLRRMRTLRNSLDCRGAEKKGLFLKNDRSPRLCGSNLLPPLPCPPRLRGEAPALYSFSMYGYR
jgi:hypothetical protein